jgi:hypothetical protein
MVLLRYVTTHRKLSASGNKEIINSRLEMSVVSLQRSDFYVLSIKVGVRVEADINHT